MPSQEHQLITLLGQHLPDPSVLADDAFLAPDGLVYTTDMLIEGQHFDLAYFTPKQLGWKLGAVNLSDIAAMGAEPLYNLVSVGLPRQWEGDRKLAFVDGLYSGLSDLLNQYGGQIVGGDTVGAQQVTLNLTAIGKIPKNHTPGLRNAAMAGDWVITTGYSGLSAVGLRVLKEQGRQAFEAFPDACEAHCRPRPQLAAGQFLSANYQRYALMDTSDGLADAAIKIAHESRQHSGQPLQLCLNVEKLLIHEELQHFTSHSEESALALVLYGGEDFQLLACVPPPETGLQETALVQAGFTHIGHVKHFEANVPVAILENEEGTVLEVLSTDKTFQHF